MDKPTEKGAKFARLTAARGVKAELAVALGVTGTVINNWKSRGVPKEYAYVVAEHLRCKPHEISDVFPVEQSISPDDWLARAENLSPERQSELRSYMEFLLEQQRAQGEKA